MPFAILGIVVIGAAIGYIYLSRTPEENKDMDSFLGKVKKAAGGIAEKSANNQKQAPVAEKYEKSDDGKVVYAFKDKGGAEAAEAAEEVKDEDPKDAE
jgi:hypothetical protein